MSITITVTIIIIIVGSPNPPCMDIIGTRVLVGVE